MLANGHWPLANLEKQTQQNDWALPAQISAVLLHACSLPEQRVNPGFRKA
jgi:hypothetical protein